MNKSSQGSLAGVRTKMPFKKVIRKHWLLLLMLLPAVLYYANHEFDFDDE